MMNINVVPVLLLVKVVVVTVTFITASSSPSSSSTTPTKVTAFIIIIQKQSSSFQKKKNTFFHKQRTVLTTTNTIQMMSNNNDNSNGLILQTNHNNNNNNNTNPNTTTSSSSRTKLGAKPTTTTTTTTGSSSSSNDINFWKNTTVIVEDQEQKPAPQALSGNQVWDVLRYQNQHSFVWQYGVSSLLELANPVIGERIIDLGCGTGELTNQIVVKLFEETKNRDDDGRNELNKNNNTKNMTYIMGIDSDPNMIHKANEQFGRKQNDNNNSNEIVLKFVVDDIRTFVVTEPVDLILSNAAFHWIPESDISYAIQSISNALKKGGRFVTEFGGKGNVQQIISACNDVVIEQYGEIQTKKTIPGWYFPSISQFTSLLEEYNIEVVFAELYNRPTILQDNINGMRNWILMFGKEKLLPKHLSEIEYNVLLDQIENKLKQQTNLYNPQQNQWIADYRRIRIMGYKK